MLTIKLAMFQWVTVCSIFNQPTFEIKVSSIKIQTFVSFKLYIYFIVEKTIKNSQVSQIKPLGL